MLTVPGYRTGPSALGLTTIAVLFLAPGFLALIGLLQLVGAGWLLAAAITAVRDVRHGPASPGASAPTRPSFAPGCATASAGVGLELAAVSGQRLQQRAEFPVLAAE